MVHTVRVSGPAELLATIPTLIGSQPEQSVVIVITRDGTTGALRIDLPGDDARTHYKQVAAQTMGLLSRVSGVRRLHLAVYTDRDIQSEPPHRDFINILTRRLRDGGFTIGDTLCHARNGWGSYSDTELPRGGHPLSDITEAAERMPRVPQAQASTPEIPTPDPDEVTRTHDALARYRALLDNTSDDDEPPELEPLRDVPRFVEAALDWNDTDLDRHGALLLFALQGPPIRDSTMLQWAFGFDIGDACYEENARILEEGIDPTSATDGGSHVFASLLMGHGPRPNRSRIRRGIRLLLTLTSRVESEQRLAPLCMLAWLNWALGFGSRAGRFIDEALSIDPRYGMAELLHTLTSGGLLPEWVFEEPDEHTEAV